MKTWHYTRAKDGVRTIEHPELDLDPEPDDPTVADETAPSALSRAPTYIGGSTVDPRADPGTERGGTTSDLLVSVRQEGADLIEVDITTQSVTWSNLSIYLADGIAERMFAGAEFVFVRPDGVTRRYHRVPSGWKALFIGGKRVRVTQGG